MFWDGVIFQVKSILRRNISDTFVLGRKLYLEPLNAVAPTDVEDDYMEEEQRKKLDICVAVLVDNSFSMCGERMDYRLVEMQGGDFLFTRCQPKRQASDKVNHSFHAAALFTYLLHNSRPP